MKTIMQDLITTVERSNHKRRQHSAIPMPISIAAGHAAEAEQIDLLAIYAAGARIHPEKSRALPQHCYGDPANNVRFERETCVGCRHERIILAGSAIGFGICAKLNEDGSKHLYGTRCTHYNEKDAT